MSVQTKMRKFKKEALAVNDTIFSVKGIFTYEKDTNGNYGPAPKLFRIHISEGSTITGLIYEYDKRFPKFTSFGGHYGIDKFGSNNLYLSNIDIFGKKTKYKFSYNDITIHQK